MRLEDFEKSKKELNEKYLKNINNTNLAIEREWLLKVNDFENKIVRILGFSMLGYFIVFLVTLIVVEKIGIASVIDMLPTAVILPGIIQVSASLLIGSTLNMILEKIFKVRKLDKETRNKRKFEKIEERINYKIERNKTDHRSFVLSNALNMLREKETMLKIVSKTLNIQPKVESATSTLSRTDEKISTLEKNLEEKYKELDILSTKYTLSKEFYSVRSKFQMMVDFVSHTFGIGILAVVLITLFPTLLLTINGPLAESLSSVLLSFFIPLTTVGAITGIYWIKRTKDYAKAFINLNSKLDKDALSRYENSYNENIDIESKIDEISVELVMTEVEIQEQKRIKEYEEQLEILDLGSIKENEHKFEKIVIDNEVEDIKLDNCQKYSEQTEIYNPHVKKKSKKSI